MSSYCSVVLAAQDEHVGRFHIWGGLKDSHLVAIVSHEGRDVPPSPCRRGFPTEIIWSLSKLPNDFPKANLPMSPSRKYKQNNDQEHISVQ